MDKKTVNQQIINGLASKGINIAEIELNHLEAFADIMYKAINVIHCCKSDSEQLKSVSRLDYSAWKDKLGLIKDVDKGLYKLNGNYITINEVLDMYDVYCASF